MILMEAQFIVPLIIVINRNTAMHSTYDVYSHAPRSIDFSTVVDDAIE